MADNIAGELRRSAVVMTFSPGAVIDMRAQGGPVSGVTAGLEEWDRSAPLIGNLKYQKVVERRLCKKLGKKYFRLPPVLDDDAKLPDGSPDPSALVVRRFPEWLQCPVCELIRPVRGWAAEPGRAYRYFASCSTARPGDDKVFAIPVRFAAACNSGHLEDFPWNVWVGHKASCTNRKELLLKSRGPGLAGLWVTCQACKQERSMDGAFRENALDGLQCRGRRPWLRRDDASCTCTGKGGTFRTVQRGASNLYYPVIDSALDIPPWTRRLSLILGDYWDYLEGVPDEAGRAQAIRLNDNLRQIIEREKLSPEEVARRFTLLRRDLEGMNVDNLRVDEYRIFTGGGDELDEEFETHAEQVPAAAEAVLSQVVRVARLREVRVTKGFTRINPPYDPDAGDMSPISVGPLEWLPAIEVRGEGVFLRLNEEKLRAWERLPAVLRRVAPAEASWQADWNRRFAGKPIPYHATPRFLLIHAFSHAMIRQLTLECGYSSASLRERLYFGDDDTDMAGVLIYTATPDSDGTLGGLQRRADPALLGPTVVGAILSQEWCSSDPLCIAGELAAPESHSVAACHSCMMVPETSCEFHNRFLDRALLVGDGADPAVGFFSGLLARRI
jgi:hypothetical protein